MKCKANALVTVWLDTPPVMDSLADSAFLGELFFCFLAVGSCNKKIMKFPFLKFLDFSFNYSNWIFFMIDLTGLVSSALSSLEDMVGSGNLNPDLILLFPLTKNFMH
jgi:hypothetical protein